MLLEGIFVPLTTPFHPDGRLFPSKLESNVERYSRTPAAGMLLPGREGEGDSLTDAETIEVLRTAVAAAADEKVMIASVGRESVRATLIMAEAAATAGYDAISVRAPLFAGDPAMRAEVLTYFRTLADGASLPVVLVDGEARPLADEVISDLAGHPQVIGAMLAAERVARVREMTSALSREVSVTPVFAAATGRMLRRGQASFVSAASLGGGAAIAVMPAQPAVKTRTKRVGFQLLATGTATMLEGWNGGASGAVPTLGACAPQACCEVWQAFKDGDPALAAEKQERVRRAAELVNGWEGIAALKYGCDLNAYFGGRPRLPLLALTAERRFEVERVLAGLKN
jgi:4-hydroxy-2-oxoglutarate aldolase